VTVLTPAARDAARALARGHDRRGRTHHSDGRPYRNDFHDIGIQYHSARVTDGPWKSITSLRPDYLVPRYYADERPVTQQELDLVRGAETASLGDLIRHGLLTLRKGHEVGSDTYGSGDVPFVRTSDISNFEISSDPTNSVSEEIYETYGKQQMLSPGDVLVVADGRYRIGMSAILTWRNYRCVIQSHLRILGTPRRDLLDPYELLFALNLPAVRLRIRDLVFVQSTLGTLGNRILELRIPVLSGRGPWRERVDTFRRCLQQREGVLSELQTMTGSEFEI